MGDPRADLRFVGFYIGHPNPDAKVRGLRLCGF